MAVTLAAGSGGTDTAIGRDVSAFQGEASNVAVKSFRRQCRIRNLLKYSSFAAMDETKPLPLCWGMGWFRHFGATGPVLVLCWSCAASGASGSLDVGRARGACCPFLHCYR